MENVIKNLGYLVDIPDKTKLDLEMAAVKQGKSCNVRFKILKYTDKDVTIQVKQEKNKTDQYLGTKDLVEIGHLMFDKYLAPKRVILHPIPYKRSPVASLDVGYINNKMTENNISLKDIVIESGLNKTYLSSLINGKKPLSDVMRAFFYFYFLSKALTKN